MNTPASSHTLSSEEIAVVLQPLKTYERGSPRGELAAAEELAAKAGRNPALARALEKEILELVSRNSLTVEAIQVIGSILLAIGSDASVPRMREYLNVPELFETARMVLAGLNTKESRAAMLDAAREAAPQQQAALLWTLALLRDDKSMRLLTQLARNSTGKTREAAIASLGEMGTSRAARVLQALAKAPETRDANRHALLRCAQVMEASGDAKADQTIRSAAEQTRK